MSQDTRSLHSRALVRALSASTAMLLAAAAGAACAPMDEEPGTRSEGRSALALSVGSGQLTMNVGDSVKVHASVATSSERLFTLSYATTDANVAKVTPDGVVTAAAAGTATIAVVATLLDDGSTTSASVHVDVADVGSASSGGASADAGAPGGDTTTWTLCAQEGERCDFTGTHPVKYGYGATTVTQTFTDGVLCANSVFGDPLKYVKKACWVGTSTAPPPPPPPVTTVDAGTTTSTPEAGASTIPGFEPTGVTAAMWSEIATQRAAFGDVNDCQARVAAIPTTPDVTLSPGDDIASALAQHSVVFLSGGTYVLAQRLVVPVGKSLIGAPGQTVTLDARAADYGVILQGKATIANLVVDGSGGDGVNFYDDTTGQGSERALVYRVASRRSGYFNTSGDNSAGFRITQNAAYNCIVSSEASDTWNEIGAPNDHGGNADGFDNSFGAHDNTFIDVRSYRNGDDGIDMWAGGVAFVYFSVAHDNGKPQGKTSQGDGNGVKLGIGSVAHKLYKTAATNNATGGFNLNGNTVQPVLVQSSASGNPYGDYINGLIAP